MADGRKERCETCRFWRDTRPRPGKGASAEMRELIVQAFANQSGMKPDEAAAAIEEASEGIADGWCRRFPPQVVMWPSGECDERLPGTSAEDWCGEWRAKSLAGLDELLARPITAIGLPSKVLVPLGRGRRFETVGDLIRVSPETLRLIRGIGPMALSAIRDALAALRLSLKGDSPTPRGA